MHLFNSMPALSYLTAWGILAIRSFFVELRSIVYLYP